MNTKTETLYLECPCCGDDGAEANWAGEFVDGQALICGCPGWVSVSEDEEPWINNGDTRCTAAHTVADDEYFRSGTRYPGQ